MVAPGTDLTRYFPELVRAAAAQLPDEVVVAGEAVIWNHKATEGVPQLYYGSVDEFVCEHLRYQYRRRIDGQRRV